MENSLGIKVSTSFSLLFFCMLFCEQVIKLSSSVSVSSITVLFHYKTPLDYSSSLLPLSPIHSNKKRFKKVSSIADERNWINPKANFSAAKILQSAFIKYRLSRAARVTPKRHRLVSIEFFLPYCHFDSGKSPLLILICPRIYRTNPPHFSVPLLDY